MEEENDDNYANWMFQFDEQATTDRFKNISLDQDLKDKLFDKGLSVGEALSEYLKLKPEHAAKPLKKK